MKRNAFQTPDLKHEVFYTPEAEQEVSLNYCGTQICEPDFSMKPHIRQEYLIHYILAGKGRYCTPQREYALKPGDLFLIYPGQPVNYNTDPYDPFHFSWFSFSGKHAAAIVDQLGFRPDDCVRHLHSRFSINDKILECVEMINLGAAHNDFLFSANLYTIFGLIAESHTLDSRSEPDGHDAGREHIDRATFFIRMNYMSPITVNDIVRFVGLERSYFSKIFHRYTGTTAQNYLRTVRVGQAKLLLERTTYSIKEITSFVGFQDESYFSRVFKELEGVSPQTYRALSAHPDLEED